MKTAWIVLLAIRPALWGCVSVNGEEIRARDVAQVVGAFAAADPDTVLGFAPAPGVHRFFSLADLRTAAQHVRVDGKDLPPEGVCFERALRQLTEQDLTSAMVEAFGGRQVDITVIDFSRYGVPPGPLVFQLAGLSSPPLLPPGAPVLWRGRVTFAGTRSMEIWARVRISALVTICLAVTDIVPGKPIESHQIRIAQLPRFPLRRDPPIDNLQNVVGRVARRPIRAGQEIVPQLLDEPQEIRAGDTVHVAALSGNARISLDAYAVSGGRRGDTIVLKNPLTQNSFRAIVDGKDRAVIHADRGGRS